MKIYVATLEALRQKEREDETQFTTQDEKLVWIIVISFCKICIPCYAFDALLCPFMLKLTILTT